VTDQPGDPEKICMGGTGWPTFGTFVSLFGTASPPGVGCQEIFITGGPVGDVNCSGGVDSIDAALALQYSAGLTSSVPCASSADVNHDGDLNSLDALLILQFVAGLIPQL